MRMEIYRGCRGVEGCSPNTGLQSEMKKASSPPLCAFSGWGIKHTPISSVIVGEMPAGILIAAAVIVSMRNASCADAGAVWHGLCNTVMLQGMK